MVSGRKASALDGSAEERAPVARTNNDIARITRCINPRLFLSRQVDQYRFYNIALYPSQLQS
jgi:hypothetical protein